MTPPRRILVPIELGDHSAATRELAASLAGAVNAELILLGIAAEPATPVGVGPLGMTAPDTELFDEGRMIDRLVQERLDEALDALPSGVHARGVLTLGPVGPAVVDAVQEQGADLVVLAMRHENALEHLLGDHIPRHVLEHSGVPVLVVPDGRDR
jgi:nucleotide-binding universal stress UspA family protein